MSSSHGIRCSCGAKTSIIDSRDCVEGRRRRHKCKKCGSRFSTYERREDKKRHLMIVATIGKDGRAIFKEFDLAEDGGLLFTLKEGEVVVKVEDIILRRAS